MQTIYHSLFEQKTRKIIALMTLLLVTSCNSQPENTSPNQTESTATASISTNRKDQQTEPNSVPTANKAAKKKPKKTSSKYINSILPESRRIQREYGIPLDLTLAIARQESGNGDYVIGKGNHFGLRCASDDCITLEKYGRQISYETCPEVSECFNIFANTVKDLIGDNWEEDESITLTKLYENGYASSPHWVRRVKKIRKEVRKTLSKAGIEY